MKREKAQGNKETCAADTTDLLIVVRRRGEGEARIGIEGKTR
jgi:hypothetical protein